MFLGEKVLPNITAQFRKTLREIESQTGDSTLLKNRLHTIDLKLAKLADAIESVGISDTLANRLTVLEEIEAAGESL